MNLQHPLIESLAVPLGVALVLTGILLAMRGHGREIRSGGIGVGIGFLAAIYLVGDGLAFPARTALQKLPYIVTGALAVGAVLEGYPPTRRPFWLAGTGCFTVALVWLSLPLFEQPAEADFWIPGVLLVAGAVALWRLAPAGGERGVSKPVMLILAALGTAGAAFNAGSLVLFQLGIALAAAAGGFALWNWPRSRLLFGPAGAVAGGIGLLSVIAMLLTLTEIRPWVLIPLLAVFFTDRLAGYLPVPRRLDRDAVNAVYIVALSVPLVAAAVALAIPAPSVDELYYY